MLAIRLRRAGSTKKPCFRVVVTEARTARDSSFVENVGTYSPRTRPAQVNLNKARIEHWLKRGARPSDSVRTLLARHLSRDISEAPGPGPHAPAEAQGLRPEASSQARGLGPEA
ncbi:MAG: 30S ribosomal protein S16 [Acidobacteria bacterium]|nr:30S ribosomal protein S16 [Acidobacteriota bacterium]